MVAGNSMVNGGWSSSVGVGRVTSSLVWRMDRMVESRKRPTLESQDDRRPKPPMPTGWMACRSETVESSRSVS